MSFYKHTLFFVIMKKILIISSNRLGDSILTSGIINFFKEKYQTSKITFVCGIIPSQLFKYSEKIERVIPLEKQSKSLHWLKLWFFVIKNYWDITIDLRGTAISYFLFTKKRIIRPFYKNKYKKIHKVSAISKYFNKDEIKPFINIKKNFNVNKYLKQSSKKRNCSFIAIAPGANWGGKQWPKEHYKSLIKNFQKNSIFKNYSFLLIGSKEEFECGRYIADYFKENQVRNLIGVPSLVEVYFILKKCNLFIGNDSGLMHLAASLDVPTIGLFGPSDAKQYKPWGSLTLTVRTPENPEQLMGHSNFSYRSNESLMKNLTVNYVEKKTISFFKKIKINEK